MHNITNNLIRKHSPQYLKYWKAVQLQIQLLIFQNALVFRKAQNFIIGNKYCQLFSLK